MTNEENSLDCGVSTGAVSNILKGWLDSLDAYDRDSIIEFTLQARKEKIKVKECAIGFRNYNMLKHLGISDDDENFGFFVKGLYELSSRLDIPPNFMQDCILEMINISKELKPSQIKQYLQTKKVEVQTIQNQLEQKKEEVHKIEQAKLIAEKNFASIRNKIDITLAELEWYINIKNELEKEGIPVENISFLTRTIKTIKKYSNKEMFSILQKINEAEKLDEEIESKKHVRDVLYIDIQTLNDLDLKLSNEVSSKASLLELLYELQKLGFDNQDLRKIKEHLTKISSENQMSPIEIKERFFELLSLYDKNITLEKENAKLGYLRSELEREIIKNRSILVSQGSVGFILRDLLNKGLNENHILLVKIFIDEMEKYNVIGNNVDSVGTLLEQSKLQHISEEDKKFNRNPAPILSNQNSSNNPVPNFENIIFDTNIF
ncbi:MAG: hypothetical protein ACE5SW_12625 [Nitrososphaeraceae archaeon]